MTHLIDALSDRENGVKLAAADALSRFGASARKATETLLQIAQKTSNGLRLREVAINALAQISVQSEEFVLLLQQQLSGSGGNKIRRSTVKVLIWMIPVPPAIVEHLRRAAKKDRDRYVRLYATEALGNVEADKKTIATLQSILENAGQEHRIAAARSLESLGAGAEPALDALMKILRDRTSSVRVRRHVARAIGRVAAQRLGEAAEALLDIVLGKGADISLRRESLASLYNLPSHDERISDQLSPLLDHGDFYIQKYTLWILFESGSFKSIDLLLTFVQRSQNPLLRLAAILTIVEIASRVRSQLPLHALPILRRAKKQLQAVCTPKPCSKKQNEAVHRTLAKIDKSIEKMTQSKVSFWSHVVKITHKYPKMAVFIAYVIGGVLISLLLFLIFPYGIHFLNERTRKIDFKLPGFLGGFTVPARFVLIVGLFSYANRVVDAWVARHINSVLPRFNKYRLVETRLRYATIQVQFEEDGPQPQDPNVLVLQAKFSGRQTLAMVHGEGGSGKTTFSIRLAHLAMMKRADLRLCPDRRMIPVMLQQNIAPQAPDAPTGNELIAEVGHELQRLIGSQRALSPAFVGQLLASGRVLLIVDGYSEKSQQTQQLIQARIGAVRTAIITSRRRERDFDVEGMGVRMLRIQSQFLISVMNVYLADSTGKVVITDEELYKACRNLANLVGKRDVTPLLVRLYAEYMKSQGDGQPDRDRPRNVPELMLGYLNEINAGVVAESKDDTDVQQAAKIVAWKCLEVELSPRPTRKETALQSLREQEADEALLVYLETTLMIIETVGVEKSQYLFIMDPVAEYLAALYLVDTYSDAQASSS